jgi:hypothetical protein
MVEVEVDCASSLKTRQGKKMSLTLGLGDKEFLKKERQPKVELETAVQPHKHGI